MPLPQPLVGKVNREDSPAAELSVLLVLSTLTTCDSLPPLMVTLPTEILSQRLEEELIYGYKHHKIIYDYLVIQQQ